MQPLQSTMNVKPVWIFAVLFLASVFTGSESFFGGGGAPPVGKRTIKLQVKHFCFHCYFWKLTWSVQLNEQPKRLKKNLKIFRLDRDRSLIFEMTGIILWTVGKDFPLSTGFGENQIPLYNHLFLINLLLSLSFWISTIFKPSPRWNRILSKIRKYSVSTNHL